MVSRPDILKGEGGTRPHELFKHLIEDVCESFKILEGQPESQYHRRTVARTVFSFVEGTVSILKLELRRDIEMERYSYNLKEEEREFLYEVKEHDGKEKRFFIPIDENIKKTFKFAVSVWRIKCFSLNTGESGYNSFIQAKETRNRLTHPKTYYDLQVTDDEMKDMARTFCWVNVSFKELLKIKISDLTKDLSKDIRDSLMKS